MDEKYCGTCKWHETDGGQYNDDWVCGNSESEIYAEYTDYDDGCEEWEPRN